MSAFPPHKSIPSVPIPQEVALKYLSSYLASTATQPHLLPNARLEASGPTAGSSSSVTLHNLQRVEAGLKGEWLAPTLELNEEVVEEPAVTVGEGEWQDLEEYQREQSIEVGEVGKRDTSGAVDLGEDSDVEVAATAGAEGESDDDVDAEAPKAKKVKTKHESGGKKEKSKMDKDARKKEKKERDKERKRRKNAANSNKPEI